MFQTFAFAFFHFFQFVRVGQVRRRGPGDLLGLLQADIEPPGPVLQRAAHGAGARRQTALIQGHEEADGAGTRVVAGGGRSGALPLHEPGHALVEVELGPIDLEIDGVRDALGEDLLGDPGVVRLPLGEVDHRFLGPPQVERRAAAVHRFADRLHVGVGIDIEQLQEEAEVGRVALVWGRGQEEHVIADVPQQLAEGVASRLAGRRRPRHAVRLVHDDQVPVDLAQAGQDLRPLGQVEGGNQLLLFEPLVDAELVADVVALDDEELLVELLLEFPLPLEGEVGRGHDQDALAHPPELEFLDQQPGHDRLAGPGVVGQEEPDAGELQQVVVDRFELVRQGIDARDGQAEVGIKLVGDAQRISLDAEAKEVPVTVERHLGVENTDSSKI